MTRIVSRDVAVLLRRVDCGAITGHHQNGQWVVFQGLTTNTVTDAIGALEKAGLVARGDWTGGDVWPRRPYTLTDTGRAELNRFGRAHLRARGGAS